MISNSDRIQQIRTHIQTHGGADRYTFLAYAFLRGIPYRNVEATTHTPAEAETILCSILTWEVMRAKSRQEWESLITEMGLRDWLNTPEDAGRFQRRMYARHAQRELRAAHAEEMKSKWGRS